MSVLHGQLYMKDFPLNPQTETRFDSTAGTIEFLPGFDRPGNASYP